MKNKQGFWTTHQVWSGLMWLILQAPDTETTNVSMTGPTGCAPSWWRTVRAARRWGGRGRGPRRPSASGTSRARPGGTGSGACVGGQTRGIAGASACGQRPTWWPRWEISTINRDKCLVLGFNVNLHVKFWNERSTKKQDPLTHKISLKLKSAEWF